ncbi:choline/glycine/proline betaine transport protein [Salegentibacter echinorum]|uniref:Choline/glycine/proline betaine transport protein n=1 Tax=Salegentibacter echinorum TaxID=1073325 RepID=A0A1M5IQP1_SALEC|nr:BCCT family transporter [Salegentibacter echinorum]SHG30632.1 choline/glycine/proline betaine transport protein [Salegentibacter echinorum]
MSIKVSRKENVSKFLGLVVNKTVFLSTIAVIIFSVLFTLIFKEEADLYFGQAQTFVSAHGGWIYTLVANFFIIFCFYLAFSRFGSLRIGGSQARPEFSGWSWFAMLFSAGIGNGLVLFSIADPVRDFLNPPRLAGESPVLIAQEAINFSFLHHGIHGWAIYCLVGLSLAYFTFNRKMPLTLRSVFYPVFGNRIYGWLGDVIDIMAVITTLFGLATTIGFGVGQINSGLTHVFGLPSSLFYQIIIITVVTLAATLSAFSGVDKGVKILSQLNVRVASLIFILVLLLGPTTFVFKSYIQNLGSYLVNFVEMATWTEALQGTDWQKIRTIMYWGWWISWSPFVGTFIARISKGRTIKEFILCVLILPALVTFLWFSAFGGITMRDILGGDTAMIAAVNDNISTALYVFFDKFPLAIVLKCLGLVLICSFIITSADSGALVVDSITSGGKLKTPAFQRVIWAGATGVIAAVLMYGGGLNALQTVVTISGLPFAILLLMMCYSLYTGVKEDYNKNKRKEKLVEKETYRKNIIQLVNKDREEKKLKKIEDNSQDQDTSPINDK